MDEATIITLLREDPALDLRLLLIYGSRAPDRDVDLLALYDTPPPRTRAMVGKVDLTALSLQQARDLISMLDPLVTEPLLTGERIYGERNILEDLLHALEDTCATPTSVRHLFRRSIQSYANAVGFLDNSPVDRSHLYFATLNISHAISYLALASYYRASPNKVTTLDSLKMSLSSELRQHLARAQDLKHLHSHTSVEDAHRLVSFYEDRLLG